MNRIENFAVYCTTAQKANYSALDGNSRLIVVKDFYASKGLEIPASITIVTTKRAAYLTKDEKIAIQSAYISALKSGEISEEAENNFNALTNSDLSVTFSQTLPFSEAVANFGPAIVAAKMIDALPVAANEEFHKIRKFEVSANIAISEIPAFIKALQNIYDSAKVEK